MTLGFGPERERFRHSLFIILVNRLVACAVAAAALGLAGKSLQPGAPLAIFSIPSVANVLGSASQYEALKYVSFPLQALAKCAKTVSGRAGRRRYAHGTRAPPAQQADCCCGRTRDRCCIGCWLLSRRGRHAARRLLPAAPCCRFRAHFAGGAACPLAPLRRCR